MYRKNLIPLDRPALAAIAVAYACVLADEPSAQSMFAREAQPPVVLEHGPQDKPA